VLLSIIQYWVCHIRSIFALPVPSLFSLCLALFSLQLYASPVDTPIKFKKLSINEGLSQSYVYDIIQDKQGFTWIATQDGLNRYDGHKVVHYRHNVSNPNSIADNFIRKLFIDKNSVLWVGTKNGLSRYNSELDNFDNYQHQENESTSLKDNEIWDIYQDKQDQIWVATREGLHKFLAKEDKFTRVRIRKLDNKLREVRTIFQDETNRYWFGTYESGIYILENDLSGAISLQSKTQNTLQIDANTLFDIKVIKNKYWLATDNGVYVVSQDDQITEHYQHNDSQPSIMANEVRSIAEIDKSNIWLATSKGLSQINLFTGQITNHTKTTHPSSLSDNWILQIYKDDNNTMWLGTNGGGVNIFNPQLALFQHGLFGDIQSSSVAALTETTDNQIWLATNKGLLNFTDNNLLTPHPLNNISDISHLLSDNNDNLWLRTVDNDLYKYSIRSQIHTKQTKWQSESKHNERNSLKLIDNDIWYIDSDGLLSSYSTNNQSFSRFAPESGYSLTSLQVESDKKIWVTNTNNELLVFDITQSLFAKKPIEKLEHYTIGQTSNIALSNSWIWLGSNDQGIALINRLTNQAKVFNESNTLTNNFVASILIDDSENAWLSTNKGLVVINPNSKLVKQFNQDFAINDNEFLSHSSLKSSDGIFYFGGLYGFHQFIPEEILKIEQVLNPPVLANLLIANNKIDIDPKRHSDKTEGTGKFVLSEQLNSTQTLELKYGQSPFSIEFTSPNAKLPEQLRYRYRLNGLETEWIESGENNQRATYTNLSAGDYVFEVQAYDLYNPALAKTKTLDIHILPPWWLSKSAIVLYAVLVMLIIAYFLQQMRHKRLYHLQIKQSEERLKLSLWGSGDEMWDWNMKREKIYRSNIWGVLEFPQDGERNVGTGDTNIHEHDLNRVKNAISEHRDGKTEHFESTYRVKDKDGKWIWILDRGKIVERDDKNRPTRMTGTLKDISQIKIAEERLKLFAKCIENISDAVVIYDRQFRTVDVNKAFQRITRKSRSKMVGTSLTFSQYPESFTQNVKKHLITKGTWHGEIESVRDNEPYLTDLNIDVIRDENGNISHFVGVFSDITKRKETEAELRKLANSDTLTGLPNRSYFQANQSRLVKNKVPHALLVFDLDNFKKINDSMGHQIGDILLCKVAERILSVGRKQDTVYRLGGDEFSIIVENTNDIHTITTIAKEILRTIAIPLKLKNQEVVLYSSIGIVLYPEDGNSPHELLKNADTAMYHAKNAGGNKYQFFSDSMNKQAVKRLQIENLIRLGLKDDYFSVFYQPKIEIATGKIAGMEALVRFETPTKGIVSPGVFIPVSEETGQIIDIGEVVLRKACHTTKKWVDSGLFDGRIAVNLSAVQFTQPNLVSLIAEILKESQLPAKYLELEITEGTVMDSPQKAIETMLQIRAMGIHLSLDDFGTGYSSLAYLKKFPLNTLKIDKAFVDDIEHSEQGRNMVATIVTIAHNLDLQVVAEGVETNQQLSFLSGLRCEQLQGYLYSKPLAEGDFQKYLLSHQIADKSTAFS